MAITCPGCGAQFDATLFQFGHRVRCPCGATIEYPGPDNRAGHVLPEPSNKPRQDKPPVANPTRPEAGDTKQTR
jgi:hypothetical protein